MFAVKQLILAAGAITVALVGAASQELTVGRQVTIVSDQAESVRIAARASPGQNVAAPIASNSPASLIGRINPLWAIPVASLTAMRERPLFAPSRRPLAPAALAPPEPPVSPVDQPRRPRLALVGAITGDSEGIAIFVDETTKGVVRLRTGEAHSGWILRLVRGREATLQKDRETATFAIANAPAK